RPAVIDRRILTFDVTAFLEALVEYFNRIGGLGGRPAAQEPDHRHGRLLRARRERPRRRPAAKRGQEFSSSDVACHVTLQLGVIHAMEGMIPRFPSPSL